MRTLFFILISVICISCDDGDIIVTSFEFEETDLKLCNSANPSEFVFYKINTSINEAISYNFIDTTYSRIQITEKPIKIDLTAANNALIYRQFSSKITDAYYCNNIPNSNIRVTNELKSTKGTAVLTVTIFEEDDSDGIPALDNNPKVKPQAIEDLNGDGNPDNDDTDGDGVPNYKDQDDDNDNILTSAELPNSDPLDNSYLDTDGDGIPNYLDDDDDGDGILTINEDTDRNGTPRNDDDNGNKIPNYLDPEDTTEVIGKRTLKNTIKIVYRTELNIFNLEFNQNNNAFENPTFTFGFLDTSNSVTTDPPSN